MSSYIKVPLEPGGTAPLKGTIQRVYARDDATELAEGDAAYFRVKAYEKYPNLDWQIEKVSNQKYIIKEN